MTGRTNIPRTPAIGLMNLEKDSPATLSREGSDKNLRAGWTGHGSDGGIALSSEASNRITGATKKKDGQGGRASNLL